MRERRWWWCLVLAWLAGASADAPRPLCPAAAGERCQDTGSRLDEYNFTVDGESLTILFADSLHFSVKCSGNVTLENTALPRFQVEVRVGKAHLKDCPAPARPYHDVMRAFNVTILGRLNINNSSELAELHFTGLPYRALELSHLRLAPNAFDAVAAGALRALRVDSVSSVAVERLPASLERLYLVRTGITNVTRASLARLTNMTMLVVRDDTVNISVEAPASVQDLVLEAGAVWLDPALPDNLKTISITGWVEIAPMPWQTCKSLVSLDILDSATKILPSKWLQNCRNLSNLSLTATNTTLTAGALQGAVALTKLTLQGCHLKTLPTGLLDDTSLLMELDLSDNQLVELPNGLFTRTNKVTMLNLSNNDLSPSTFAIVAAAKSLHKLYLSHNPRLGDACPLDAVTINTVSQLRELSFLSEVRLRNTGASVVCRDFRDGLPRLRVLDLRDNRFTYLGFDDLQFRKEVIVDLTGNNVTGVVYLPENYDTMMRNPDKYCAGDAPHASLADVRLGDSLRCDCTAAWLRLALRDCPRHLRSLAAACRPGPLAGRALAALDPAALRCALPAAQCVADAAPCECSERYRPEAPRRVLRVSCAASRLSSLPRMRRADAAWELLLPHNAIAAPALDALPAPLLELDLRSNGVESPEVVTSLLAEDRRLLLGGNRLRCECDDAVALNELVGKQTLVADYGNLTCAGGGRPAPRPAADCTPSAAPRVAGALAAALLPLLLAAALLAACLARRSTRGTLKALLRGAGLWPRAPEPDDDRPFDVFLSFSHRDHAVEREVLARLEGGARPFRVCVHYRDWAPGGWIPAQIAASVRRSRRTVALVSAHFLASTWALAEFREAYAAALREAEPRLVVVLLDDPARLPLDAELRQYLDSNTYVRWGDLWFWRKLLAALPPPRGRAPPAAAPALPAGPPVTPSAQSSSALEPLMQLSPLSLAEHARGAGEGAAVTSLVCESPPIA